MFLINECKGFSNLYFFFILFIGVDAEIIFKTKPKTSTYLIVLKLWRTHYFSLTAVVDQINNNYLPIKHFIKHTVVVAVKIETENNSFNLLNSILFSYLLSNKHYY